MDVFTFAFLCTLIGCSIPLSKIWLNRKRGVDDEDLRTLYGEIDRLRERVETLEKIITDDKYELHREFQKLEDVS